MSRSNLIFTIGLLSLLFATGCGRQIESGTLSGKAGDRDKIKQAAEPGKKGFTLPKFNFKIEPRLIKDRNTPVEKSYKTKKFSAGMAAMVITCQKKDSSGGMKYCRQFTLNGKTQQGGYEFINSKLNAPNSYPFDAVKIEYSNEPGIFMCVVMMGFPTGGNTRTGENARTDGGGRSGGFYYRDDDKRSDRYSFITYCDTSDEIPRTIVGGHLRFSNRIKSLKQFKATIKKPYPLIMLEAGYP